MRVLLGAFGDPGHAFPVLALGAELVGRGHEVGIETWQKWREPAEAAGMMFSAAPEYQVFPTRERPLKPYEAAVIAAKVTRSFVRDFRPDVAVSDILTPAPALAAELEGVPVATVVPHVMPDLPPGFPPFSIGARLPRTRLGRALWKQTYRAVEIGLDQGRSEYNDCRARLGLGPLPWTHTGLSRSLTMVGTFPQLEYPRTWPSWTRVVGPLMWEPGGPVAEPVPGDGPVVLVATSTSQDPSHHLLDACLEGLADEPVRVIAISAPTPGSVQRRARVVDLLRRDDAALRPGDHPRRARDAGAGSGFWLPGAGLPGRWGHGRERRAGRLGGGRRAARGAVRHAARRAAGRPARVVAAVVADARVGVGRVGPGESRAHRGSDPAGALG